MPYESHPDLRTPPNGTVLWRYMDLARFVDLVENRALWFTRLDQLEDPLEGSHTDAELAGIRKYLDRDSAERLIAVFRAARKELFVNCWRSGKNESLAMWDLYGKGSGIVAVKSTVGRLKKAVEAYNGSVFISRLWYLDWNTKPGIDNVLVACSRKDISYQHEAEVRAIIMEDWSDPKEKGRPGIRMPVEIERLITEVVVGPREQKWVVDLVGQILRRYNLAWPVIASNRLTPRR